VIESAGSYDEHDQRALQDAIHEAGLHGQLQYEHVAPKTEPMLWAADAIVFAYAAGGELRPPLPDTHRASGERRA